MPEMLKAGVALFGGCCGTTEEHIAALKAALKDAEYVRPAPECLDLLPAATEKEAFFLPPDATHGAVLTADGDLEDKLSDAMDDEWPMVALEARVLGGRRRAGGLPVHDQKALCLICDDAELLEAGLRRLSGKSLVRGKSHRRCPLRRWSKNTVCWCKKRKKRTDGNEHFRPVLYIVKRVTPRRRQC